MQKQTYLTCETSMSEPRKGDGMIRCKVHGGGPLGWCDHFNIYPPYERKIIPSDYTGWYTRKGTLPNFTYHWEPRTLPLGDTHE